MQIRLVKIQRAQVVSFKRAPTKITRPRKLKHQNLVRPSRPLGQFRQRAVVCAVGELVVGHTARFHAGAANTDLAAMPDHVADHHLDVVKTLRYLLSLVRGRGAIADQEDAYFIPTFLGKRTSQAQSVIGALAAGCFPARSGWS